MPGRPLILAFALATAAALGLGWRWRGRADRHLAEATRRVEAGAFAEALDWLDAPLASAATRPRALILRARIALGRGRADAAIAPLDRVDADGPLGGEVAYWRARTLQDLGDWPLAIAWYRRAIDRRPEDSEALRGLAGAAYALGDRGSVLEALNRLTGIRPEDPAAWRALALVIREEPDGGPTEFAATRAALERSLALAPDQPDVRLELSETLLRQGDYEEAERQLGLASDASDRAGRHFRRAQCAWGRGDREAALERLEEGLRIDPEHAGLLGLRGTIDQSDGRHAEAIDRLTRAIAADPLDSQLHYRRGVSLRVSGRTAEADVDAARSEALKAEAQAMAALNAEAAARPADPEPRVRLGRLCEGRGQGSLAASWYRAALACDPGHRAARAGLERARGPSTGPVAPRQ